MVVLGTVAVLLIVGRSLAGVYSDYLWYDSLGAVALWRTRVTAMIALRVGSAIAAGLFAFANLYAVRQSVVSLVLPRRLGNLEIGEEVPGRYLMGAAIALSALLGALLAVPQNDWTSLVLARAARPFGDSDPYFGADLSFFVYWLPFENSLWTWAFFSVIVVTVVVILLYALTPSLKWQRGALYASTYVRRHFTVLIGVILLMLAWGYRLDMYSLVMEGSGPDGAFSWVDHRVGVPGDLLLALATLGAALIVLWAGFAGQIRLAGISVFTVVAMSLLIREVVPAIAQHTGTDAERAAHERPYQATRAGYTRRAFAVDAIPRADSSFAYPSLAAALPWVPVWDAPALARAIDGGRSGDEQSVGIEWRWSPAGLAADVVEPPPPGAAPRAPWTVARVLANDADDRGAPVRLAGPRASATDDSPLDAPLVYPGAPSFLIIADSLNHSAGSPLEPTLARVASAWTLQNFRILSRDLPQPRPTLIAHRDVRDRIDRFMPFFAQGRRIDPLLVGDSLYWSVDLYSVSSTYPLSRHALLAGEDRSYFRHAAIAIVQASTGDISVVPDSALDPIAATWVRRLPSIFGTWSALPTGIRALLAPPIDGLYAQAAAFGRYGSRNDTDPPRHVPTIDGADTTFRSVDLPIVLPGTQTTALALPLADDTDRLRGLLIGTGGATRLTVWYPLPTPGPRWTAVIDRLRSVDSAGSAAREGPLAHGRIRSVPVRSGIGFVQPTYRWRPPSVPTLNRVAVLVGDTTRSVAPGSAALVHVPAGSGAAGKVSAAALYALMRDALRRGDWAAFGRAFEGLGRALGQPTVP
ncbi:MAG: hypothetical protein JWM41_520 [Gemmatimonadetes bacterium]|nr:hypothetical protein [Gemmatimonadota bacterium]